MCEKSNCIELNCSSVPYFTWLLWRVISFTLRQTEHTSFWTSSVRSAHRDVLLRCHCVLPSLSFPLKRSEVIPLPPAINNLREGPPQSSWLGTDSHGVRGQIIVCLCDVMVWDKHDDLSCGFLRGLEGMGADDRLITTLCFLNYGSTCRPSRAEICGLHLFVLPLPEFPSLRTGILVSVAFCLVLLWTETQTAIAPPLTRSTLHPSLSECAQYFSR